MRSTFTVYEFYKTLPPFGGFAVVKFRKKWVHLLVHASVKSRSDFPKLQFFSYYAILRSVYAFVLGTQIAERCSPSFTPTLSSSFCNCSVS